MILSASLSVKTSSQRVRLFLPCVLRMPGAPCVLPLFRGRYLSSKATGVNRPPSRSHVSFIWFIAPSAFFLPRSWGGPSLKISWGKGRTPSSGSSLRKGEAAFPTNSLWAANDLLQQLLFIAISHLFYWLFIICSVMSFTQHLFFLISSFSFQAAQFPKPFCIWMSSSFPPISYLVFAEQAKAKLLFLHCFQGSYFNLPFSVIIISYIFS